MLVFIFLSKNMSDKNKIILFKTWTSKQIDDKSDELFSSNDWVIEPEVWFEELLYAYDNCSIISWIVKKIASKVDSWFIKTDNEELDKMLKNLDIDIIAQNLLTFWNSFSERLKNWKTENLLEFEVILTPSIRKASKNTKDITYYQRSKKWIKKVPFSSNEVLFFKRWSLGDKHYWDSLFNSCIDEVVLLAFITKYYKNFFAGGNIEPNILYDELWNLTDEQIEKIEEMIKTKISWIDNSHNTLFVTWKIWKIDLSTKIDPDKFIALKRELKEDIAISTNIPFDLLSSKNSNRANSEVALETLYADIILPLQSKILRQLKTQLLSWKRNDEKDLFLSKISEEEINEIEFNKVDLKNWVDEMRIAVWYKKAWITTANEERVKMWLEEIVWWDELQTSWWSEFSNKEDSELASIEKELEDTYTSKWWNFLSKIWLWKNNWN